MRTPASARRRHHGRARSGRSRAWNASSCSSRTTAAARSGQGDQAAAGCRPRRRSQRPPTPTRRGGRRRRTPRGAAGHPAGGPRRPTATTRVGPRATRRARSGAVVRGWERSTPPPRASDRTWWRAEGTRRRPGAGGSGDRPLGGDAATSRCRPAARPSPRRPAGQVDEVADGPGPVRLVIARSATPPARRSATHRRRGGRERDTHHRPDRHQVPERKLGDEVVEMLVEPRDVRDDPDEQFDHVQTRRPP